MPAGAITESLVSAPPVALTIAGFDPSSGAGITADLQVFAAHGFFGTSCITALTVQSTQGVVSVDYVHTLIGPTLDHLEDDLPPAGIKIGMLGSAEAVRAVAGYLRRTNRAGRPVVLDPVLVSSSGRALLDEAGLTELKSHLLPLVDWITPNRAELHALGEAVGALHAQFPRLHIVETGGDEGVEATDVLCTPDGQLHTFQGERVRTTSTHGTGCAFSSALLCRLILGDNPLEAVAAAKAYVSEALGRAPGLGKGKGPLHLLWPLG